MAAVDLSGAGFLRHPEPVMNSVAVVSKMAECRRNEFFFNAPHDLPRRLREWDRCELSLASALLLVDLGCDDALAGRNFKHDAHRRRQRAVLPAVWIAAKCSLGPGGVVLG